MSDTVLKDLLWMTLHQFYPLLMNVHFDYLVSFSAGGQSVCHWNETGHFLMFHNVSLILSPVVYFLEIHFCDHPCQPHTHSHTHTPLPSLPRLCLPQPTHHHQPRFTSDKNSLRQPCYLVACFMNTSPSGLKPSSCQRCKGYIAFKDNVFLRDAVAPLAASDLIALCYGALSFDGSQHLSVQFSQMSTMAPRHKALVAMKS